MSNLIKAAVLTGVLTLLALEPANATTGPAALMADGTPGTPSNLGSVSGSAQTFPSATFTVGGATVSCTTVNLPVTTVTATGLTVDPDYTGCTLLVSGTPVAAVTVDMPCGQDISVANGTFNTSTAGITGGTMTTTCDTTATIEAVNCTLHIAQQTREGISVQNVNQAGTNDTSATPWGAKITASVSGLTYDATGSCPGIAAHGTGTYSSTVMVRAITGRL